MPSWAALQQHFVALTEDKPEDLHERGISDHVPVVISVSARQVAPAEEQRIPSHFFKDPEFAAQYERLRVLVDWSKLG
eukprot:2403568-Pyramimonas_sp.AAC.1